MFSKTVIMIIIFIGILCITINLVKTEHTCPKQQIIYRYIPRSFEQEVLEPVMLEDIFVTMFSRESPWTTSVNAIDTRKHEAINKYFISQY